MTMDVARVVLAVSLRSRGKNGGALGMFWGQFVFFYFVVLMVWEGFFGELVFGVRYYLSCSFERYPTIFPLYFEFLRLCVGLGLIFFPFWGEMIMKVLWVGFTFVVFFVGVVCGSLKRSFRGVVNFGDYLVRVGVIVPIVKSIWNCNGRVGTTFKYYYGGDSFYPFYVSYFSPNTVLVWFDRRPVFVFPRPIPTFVQV